MDGPLTDCHLLLAYLGRIVFSVTVIQRVSLSHMIDNGVADIRKLHEIFRILHLMLLQTLGIESLYHKFLVLYNSVILIWEPQIMETGGALVAINDTLGLFMLRSAEIE